ncbi:MAG: YtxH domain-containing protein [Bryobacterales bacterium]|nr:YtxH domain-containing protein [Bryobacterales bacterium]MBV9399631.1 YtxH domain-containing protein [Bryobacterales bacterium]
MDEDNKVSYFLFGLGIGVAVGVLFAPRSGEETREYIKGKTLEGADYMRRASQDLRDAAEGALDRGKESLRRQKDTLTAAVEAGKQAYRDATNNPSAG